MDIKAAYLYTDLKEDIYMKMPEDNPNFWRGYFKLKKKKKPYMD